MDKKTILDDDKKRSIIVVPTNWLRTVKVLNIHVVYHNNVQRGRESVCGRNNFLSILRTHRDAKSTNLDFSAVAPQTSQRSNTARHTQVYSISYLNRHLLERGNTGKLGCVTLWECV